MSYGIAWYAIGIAGSEMDIQLQRSPALASRGLRHDPVSDSWSE